MITLEQYYEGRDKDYPPTETQAENASELLEKVELLGEALDVDFVLTSGYRPEALIESSALPGTPHDAHSQCMGIDLHDPGLVIATRLANEPSYLEDSGLWMESPASSKNHLHVQSYAPKSGRRVFLA